MSVGFYCLLGQDILTIIECIGTIKNECEMGLEYHGPCSFSKGQSSCQAVQLDWCKCISLINVENHTVSGVINCVEYSCCVIMCK